MDTQRIIHVPAVGKGPELWAALDARNATGNKFALHALTQHMFSPQQAYVHGIRFENLAAIEAYYDAPLPNPEVGRRIEQCMARERAVLLYEGPFSTPVTTTPKFLRNRLTWTRSGPRTSTTRPSCLTPTGWRRSIGLQCSSASSASWCHSRAKGAAFVPLPSQWERPGDASWHSARRS